MLSFLWIAKKVSNKWSINEHIWWWTFKVSDVISVLVKPKKFNRFCQKLVLLKEPSFSLIFFFSIHFWKLLEIFHFDLFKYQLNYAKSLGA